MLPGLLLLAHLRSLHRKGTTPRVFRQLVLRLSLCWRVLGLMQTSYFFLRSLVMLLTLTDGLLSLRSFSGKEMQVFVIVGLPRLRLLKTPVCWLSPP